MAQPPNLNYKTVTADEMKHLVNHHSVETKLANCSPQRNRQPQDANHEQFCCTKYLVLFTDANGDEVAVVIEQIHADKTKGTTRTFTGLRIGNDVYRLRIP